MIMDDKEKMIKEAAVSNTRHYKPGIWIKGYGKP
jgi:hypothetical protein